MNFMTTVYDNFKTLAFNLPIKSFIYWKQSGSSFTAAVIPIDLSASILLVGQSDKPLDFDNDFPEAIETTGFLPELSGTLLKF